MTTTQSQPAAADNLPLPNIYYATIQSALDGETRHLYVAADFTGAAIKKVANLCVERFNFRPYRSNSAIKLRRLRLQDYVESPGALSEAILNAHELGERETIQRLKERPAQVAKMLEGSVAPIDAEAAMAELGAALRAASA